MNGFTKPSDNVAVSFFYINIPILRAIDTWLHLRLFCSFVAFLPNIWLRSLIFVLANAVFFAHIFDRHVNLRQCALCRPASNLVLY